MTKNKNFTSPINIIWLFCYKSVDFFMRNGNIPEFYRAHYSISWIAFTNCERKDQATKWGLFAKKWTLYHTIRLILEIRQKPLKLIVNFLTDLQYFICLIKHYLKCYLINLARINRYSFGISIYNKCIINFCRAFEADKIEQQRIIKILLLGSR